MKSVVAGVPYPLGKDLVKDLVTYAVSRSNLKASTRIESNVCPRIRFTGYKPDFKTELSLAFGDYVEAYDPRSKGKSNDVMTARTEPCVALYPSANRNGSWMFYNLVTKAHVQRSQWKKLPVTQFVIDAMKVVAGEMAIEMQEADQLENSSGGIEHNERDQDVHHPVYVPMVEMTDEEVRLQESDAVEESAPADNDVPELCDPDRDDDSDSESGDTSLGEDQELEELDA